MKNPKVTVITPVYDQEKFVAEAIESVLNQTFRDFELIICDDGSTDGSLKIIKKYAQKDARIKVMRNIKNIGLTKTLNKMLRAAKGEYVCQIDSDDIFMSNRLEVAVKFMDEHEDVAATYSDCYWIDEKGNIIREIKCMEFDLNMLLASEYINQVTIMYRKEYLDKIGLYEEELKYSQDTLMKLEVGRMFGFTRIPETLVKYRIREGSITSSKADEQKRYSDLAKKKFLNKYQDLKTSKVTVGVPVYNPNMEYLKECLESIRSQEYENYEAIVLDDGSDNKGEIEKLARGFGFKYFYQKNRGIGGARNAIIDNMSEDTDYLCYLSYDDIMHPEYMKVMCQAAGQNKGCIIYSSFLIINDKGQTGAKYNVPVFETIEDFCVACLSYAERNTMFVNFSTTFLPSDIIKKDRFDGSLRYGEDLEFLLRTALVKKRTYVHAPHLLVKIRMHMDSVTTKKQEAIPENNAKILDKIYKQLKGGD